MPNINPNIPPRRAPPQPPVQFENRTPDSFQRNGFVNTTPARSTPNPHQAPANPDFINLTPQDFLPPRPELHIDTTVGGGRPVGDALASAQSEPSPGRTLSAYSDASGRHAPMHPGLGGSSSVSPGSPSSGMSEMGSPLDPFRLLTPPPPSTLPSLASPGSSATDRLSPYTPRAPMSDDGHVYDAESPSRMISRSPSFEIPESPNFAPNYPFPITRVASPDRSTAPSPSPDRNTAPTPGYAPTPGAGDWPSPGSYPDAPTPQAYRSPTPLGSTAPTPGYAPTPGAYGSSPSSDGYGYAPTPGGYMSPTPGMENAAHALLNLNPTPEAPLSRAPTPGYYAPTPGGPMSSPSPEPPT